MINFHIDYFLCCTLILIGVLQICAIFSQLTQFQFSSRPILNMIAAKSLIGAGFILFFSTENRNINDYEGGLDGNEQTVLFALALAFALISVALFTSLLNRDDATKDDRCQEHSVTCLNHDTYFQLIKLQCKNFFKK